MPTENRFIVFNYEEIYIALRIRKITENQELPPDGVILNIDFPDIKSNRDIIIVTLQSKDNEQQKIEFTREFFALALVFYCQGHDIPIPRAGTKSLVKKNDAIVLHIEITPKPSASNNFSPKH